MYNFEHMMKSILTGLLLLASTMVIADSFRDGVVAYQNKNHKLAFQSWLPLAEDGHVVAQSLIGTMYAYGEGVEQDNKKAIYWLSKAAEYGSSQAQFNLAVMHEKGLGVDADLETARKWFKASADQGREDAAARLAILDKQLAAIKQVQAAKNRTEPEPAFSEDLSNFPEADDSAAEEPRVELTFKPKPVRSPATETITASPPPRQDFNGLKGIQWLQQQAGHHYTIQLAASVQPRLIKAYIKQLGLNEGYAHTVTLRNKQTWHTLIYGSYPSYKTAKQALKSLPQRWRSWKPWVRTFSSVTTVKD